MNSKLIIELNGVQSIIEVGQGGYYSGPGDTVFDERIDGPMSNSMLTNLGGILKANGSFSIDLEKKSLHDAAIASVKKSKQDKQKYKDDAMTLLNGFDLNKDPTNNELKALVKAFVTLLKGN